MAFSKSQTKRQRELAKLNKRQAKDQKRALRKAERSGAGVNASPPAASSEVRPATPSPGTRQPAVGPPKPATLAEAVERWKNMKVPPPRKR